MSLFFNEELDENGEDIWKDMKYPEIEHTDESSEDMVPLYEVYADIHRNAIINMHKILTQTTPEPK